MFAMYTNMYVSTVHGKNLDGKTYEFGVGNHFFAVGVPQLPRDCGQSVARSQTCWNDSTVSHLPKVDFQEKKHEITIEFSGLKPIRPPRNHHLCWIQIIKIVLTIQSHLNLQ